MSEEPDQERFKAWLDERKALLSNDQDEVIVITGDERSGKSTLAFLIACYLDPQFDPTTSICFTGSSYTRTSARLGKRRVVILDEAISGGFSRDSGSTDNKQLIKYLTVAGELNQIHIILWPNIRWLDKVLKEHRAKWNLHITKRYRNEALAWVRQLRDGEFVFETPKRVFPFVYPPASGVLWDKYQRMKEAFVQEVGRGTDDAAVMAQEDFLDMVRREVGPYVNLFS